MYEWKLKELKIRNNEVDTSSWTLAEKIAFIDKHENGKMSYILDLINKYVEDLPTLKKDSYGHVKTVSLKAWLKKNDPLKMVDDWYQYGQIDFLRTKRSYTSLYITNPNIKDEAINSVDIRLNETLRKLKSKEDSYFATHDPYSIEENEFETNGRPSFGNHIIYGSSGVFVRDDNGNDRKLTLEELQLLNEGARKLEEYRKELSKEINITF